MRNTIIWLPIIIAILICAVIALRAQVAPPPMADSDSITFTEDSTGCRFSIYGSARGLEVVRSRHACVVNIADQSEPI